MKSTLIYCGGSALFLIAALFLSSLKGPILLGGLVVMNLGYLFLLTRAR